MIPVLFTYSVVYFFMRIDAYGDDAFKDLDKSWVDVLTDGLFGTWMADKDHADKWVNPTWTLGIELIATFWIYLFAMTVRAYEKRYWIYIIVITTLFGVHLAVDWSPNALPKWSLTDVF
jgi:peptidoglycan/LPS O-acetylase OafA/YrhL